MKASEVRASIGEVDFPLSSKSSPDIEGEEERKTSGK